MKYFIDKLLEKIEEKNSRICVGLDPHLHLMPESILDKSLLNNIEDNKAEIAAAIYDFNKVIIDNVYDITAVVKPQLAFYEKLGESGIKALWKTAEYAKSKGLLLLFDGKRNDIGSTASAYAEAYLNQDSGADALTINPYLGSDGINPFLENINRGVFALVKTSNKSSGELQDLELKTGEKIYEKVGKYIDKLGEKYRGKSGYSNLCAVVGATYPEELKGLRKIMPGTFYLIPGFGAQGGGVEDVRHGFKKDGTGAVVNSSRGIIFAYSKKGYEDFSENEFGKAARKAAVKMKSELNNIF